MGTETTEVKTDTTQTAQEITSTENAQVATAATTQTAAVETKEATTESQTQTDGVKKEIEYSLKMPENSKLSQARLDSIIGYAKEQGISNEKAQALLEQENQMIADYEKSQIEHHRSVIVAGWEQESLKDPEIFEGSQENFNRNIEVTKQFLDKHGPDLKPLLDQTGFGSHPAVVKFLVKVAKMGANDSMTGNSLGTKQGEQPKGIGDLLYPLMDKKTGEYPKTET